MLEMTHEIMSIGHHSRHARPGNGHSRLDVDMNWSHSFWLWGPCFEMALVMMARKGSQQSATTTYKTRKGKIQNSRGLVHNLDVPTEIWGVSPGPWW